MQSLFPTEILDQPESHIAYFVWFGWFALFALSLLGWGLRIERKYFRSVSEQSGLGLHLAFGSAFLATMLGVATLLMSPAWVGWLCLVLVLGGILNFRARAYRWDWKTSHLDNLLMIVLAMIVLLRVCEGFYLHRHADGLIAYLTAGRSWVMNGFQEFVHNPVYFFSSTWEQLFLFGLLPGAKSANAGLAQGQRFGQWCTAFIAGLGTIAILYRFARQLHAGRTFALAATLAATTLPILRWMQNLAKNDVGVAFWALAGCAVLHSGLQAGEPRRRNARLFLAGGLLGMAIIGKLSGYLILIPAFAVLIWRRPGWKAFLLFAAGGAAGAMPILVRNFILTGNPLFPFLNGVFKSPVLSPSFATTVDSLSQPLSEVLKAHYLLAPFTQQPWLWIAPVALLVSLFSARERERLSAARPWLLGVLIATVIFCFGMLPQSELRYLGAVLMLLSLFSILSIEPLLSRVPDPLAARARTAAVVTISLAVIALSNLPLFTLAQIARGKYSTGTTEVIQHSAGQAKKWIRDHAGSAGTVTLGDNQLYYMSGYRYHEISYYSPLDLPILQLETGEAIVDFLRKEGYRFVVDARAISPWDCHNKIGAERLVGTLRKYPRAKVFDEGNVQIYDLEQLWAVASAPQK